ncbi:MAG: SDR family oxidoreductase [Bacteroidales bacterium]|nr:SDR family oxidoreductase [Bacteroidales bacterium]MDT8373386.1 SDR family oxidoreductase [Bacteroidales bacterium]
MKKVVLITGISSGFGKHTADLLAAEGHTVYGTVRKEVDLSSGVHVLRMDLTDADSVRDTVATVFSREKRIDVLINNAGMHTGGPAETIPDDFLMLQMETNFIGTVRITREVLPVMRNQGGGTIINFSSIGGLMGLPFQSYYSAAKFALEGLSEALRLEVRQFNIRVVLINPGDFRTNNTINRRNFLAATNDADPYHAQYSITHGIIERDETGGMDPVKLAKRIVKIMHSRKPRLRYVIASPDQKLSVLLKRFLPERWFMKIIGSYYRVR